MDVTRPLAKPSWVQCPEGMFMRSLYAEDGLDQLSSIQRMGCCGVEAPPWSWSVCNEVDVQVLLPARHSLCPNIL
jgi:hypothetical protein